LSRLARRARVPALLAVPVALAAVAVPLVTDAGAAPGQVLPCVTREVTKPFTAWGDHAAYFTVPGGTFEGGAPGWTLGGGAAVTHGNEPWRVLSSTHASSLALPAGAAATAPSMCIATAEDALRFFYRAPGVRGAALLVTIHVTSGVNVADNTYEISGATAGWALSPRIMLPDIRDASGRQTVTISFTQRSTRARWQIDDVEVDPWRSL
jgi:hypothetical protein